MSYRTYRLPHFILYDLLGFKGEATKKSVALFMLFGLFPVLGQMVGAYRRVKNLHKVKVMKDSLLSGLFVCSQLLLTSCSQDKALITGTIEDFNDKCVVTLLDIETATQDTVPVGSDGTFRIEVDAPEPVARFLTFTAPKSGMKLFIKNGMKAHLAIRFEQTIEDGMELNRPVVDYQGDHAEAFRYWEKHSFYDAQNRVLDACRGRRVPFQDFRLMFEREVEKELADVRTLNDKDFIAFDEADFAKKLHQGMSWYIELSDTTDSDFDRWLQSLDRNNPDNMLDARIYLEAWKKFCLPKTPDRDKVLLDTLPTLFSNKEVCQGLTDELRSQMAATTNALDGKETTDFEMKDASGHTVRLSDFAGKTVYIDVWATWCGPCNAELPYMAKLAKQYEDSTDVVFISVSLDTDADAWQRKLKREHFGWPQYRVEGAFESVLCKAYGISAIPRFLLISKNWQVVSSDAPRPSEKATQTLINEDIGR